MLGGIVFMQVSLLKLNSGISRSVETAATLERVNAGLETEVARLSSGERIQRAAAGEDMVAPPAGDVGYLTARPGVDPRLAARRMQSPSDEAKQVMASGGHAPAALAPSTVTPVVPETAADAGHRAGPDRHRRARADDRARARPDRDARAAPAGRDRHRYGRHDGPHRLR